MFTVQATHRTVENDSSILIFSFPKSAHTLKNRKLYSDNHADKTAQLYLFMNSHFFFHGGGENCRYQDINCL